MRKGGTILDKRKLEVTQIIGLVTPVLLALYGLAIMAGYGPNDHFVNSNVFTFISLGWIAYGIYQYLNNDYGIRTHILNLTVYHVFAILYLLFVSGFSTVALSGWVLLYFATYLYTKLPGVAVSGGVLLLAASIDIAVRDYTMYDAVTVMINIIGSMVVGSAVIAISYLHFTERSALNESQRREHFEHDRILTIVNNLADAVFSTDLKGVVRVHNAAALSLLDTNQDINGKHINDILKLENDKGTKQDSFAHIKEALRVTVNDDFRLKTTTEKIRLELTYAPIRSTYRADDTSGRGEGYIVIARDVTKLKSLEEERDEFISVVSHELRTPVTVAEGTISNLQLMHERGMTDKQKMKDNLQEAHEQVLFLANMINDLSTLSRAERGIAGETERVDLAEMAHSIFNEHHGAAQAQGLHLNLELGTKLADIETNRLYLHELLQNFITNSLKYTHEGTVTLAIKRHQNKVLFAVSDTGIGISKSDQKKVFDKFYRSEDYRTRETGGTGLGLYVAQKLAKKIGADIQVSSRLNHGSTFSFELSDNSSTR